MAQQLWNAFLSLGPDTANARCGLCGAPRLSWFVDVGVTQWQNLAEAKPYLAENHAQQMATRDFADRLKRKAQGN